MQVKRTLYLIIYILLISNTFSQNLNLKINGKNELETKVIDSLDYTKKHNNYLSLKSEVDSLQKKLYKLGYIENYFSKLKKPNDTLFTTSFNLNTKYKSAKVYFNEESLPKELLQKLASKISENYFVLNFAEIEYTLEFINSEIAKEGFPFSKLRLDEISIIKNNVEAKLVIDSEIKKRSINKIVLNGYEKFPKSYIKHFLKIKEGSVFDIEAIKKKTQSLNNLPFANQIKDPEVLFTKDSTTLYLYLEKQKSNNFDGFLGFGTNEETNKIEFDGYLNLNLTNNLNYGESFSLLYKSDENEQRTFEANFNLPYLFNSPLGTELELNIFRKDSTFTITNQTANLFYQINSKQRVFAGINSTQSNNLLDENNSLTIQDYTATFYKAKYEVILRSDFSFLFPINFQMNFEGGIGKRKTDVINEDQLSLDINTFKIFNLNMSNSIFLKLIASSLISDNYFENELRRFGGINSIRGFEENSIFATLHSTIITEYRYQFGNNLYLHSIFDAAYFENKLTNTKEKLFGFGFGFGLLTKSGLLKFNYANGKREQQKFKFSDSKIHLSLVAFF